MTHAFEQAGLGKGPFECLEIDFVSEGEACQLCGTKIKYRHWVDSADGKRFFIGSECMKKNDQQMFIGCSPILRQLKREAELTEADKEFYADCERVV